MYVGFVIDPDLYKASTLNQLFFGFVFPPILYYTPTQSYKKLYKFTI